MEILLDALVALFSCIGIWTLWNMLQNHLFNCREEPNVFTDIPDHPEYRTKEAHTWTKQKSTIK